ncbi:hypothetical protein [Desulfosporosinus sp. Sb-LF]
MMEHRHAYQKGVVAKAGLIKLRTESQ